MYIIIFILQNYRNLKKIFLNLTFYIDRIFTPERESILSNGHYCEGA